VAVEAVGKGEEENVTMKKYKKIEEDKYKL
jgi:hypothetical protein